MDVKYFFNWGIGGTPCATDVFSVCSRGILKVYVNSAAEPYLFSNINLVILSVKNKTTLLPNVSMSTKHKAKSMTLRKPGLQDPLSSPPSPESEGPGTHTLTGGAAWPGGAEMNILEAIKLLRSEIVEMKTQVVATIEARIQEVSDTLKADLTILRNETVPAITILKTTTASHTTTIAALEASATNVSD